MAGGGVPQGKGRKGVSDLNLVPFVDLFSTLIIFLLSVAVWDQLAAVPVNLGAQDKPSIEVPKQDIKKVESNVKITVLTDGVELFNEGKSQKLAKVEGQPFDFTPVAEFVAAIRQNYPDKKDMLIMATDQAVYEDIVGVMDRALEQDFDQIIVTGLDQK